MEKLSKGEIFPKIVEAYSRPTRIVRGKDIGVGVEVLVRFLSEQKSFCANLQILTLNECKIRWTRVRLRLPKRERCGALTPLSKIDFTLVTLLSSLLDSLKQTN